MQSVNAENIGAVVQSRQSSSRQVEKVGTPPGQEYLNELGITLGELKLPYLAERVIEVLKL